MKSIPKRENLYESEEGKLVERELRLMVLDASYRTEAQYTANIKYPDHRMPFIDHHMAYLQKHPEVRLDHYLANLRLKLKIR